MPGTSGTSTARSSSRLGELRKKRARRKARFNEIAFSDTFGEPIRNNWHHLEWFDLTEEHDRLLIEAAREHAKTEIFGKCLPLFELGVNPNVRILIVSATFDQAKQRARVLREHIERNERYRAIFPHVRIASKQGDEQFTVERDRILKEPTVLSTYAGGPIPGYRFDIVILDDLVSFLSNSTTAAKRTKLHRWVSDEVLNSVAKGGKVWVIGTRQHHDDEYEKLKEDERFHSVTYPAVDEEDVLGYRIKNEALCRGITGHDVVCLWPAMHDHASLMAKKAANPDSFARQQQQVAIPETGLVWRREVVDPAFERGKRVRPDRNAAQYLALDPGYSKRAALLAIQERAGDRIDLWGEYSFTEMDDDTIARVVAEHAEEWRVRTVYMDAEDPKLAKAISRELENRGLETEIVRVPFGNYKLASIGATRWLLGGGRVSWRGETTTVYRPGGVRVEKSLFRKETRDYALDPNNEGHPLKDDDHGPDAWTAYAYKWIEPWLEATEGKDEAEAPIDRALQRA